MTDKLYLDKNFSTTQLLTKEKPAIENHPEDKLDSVLFLPENPERKGEGGLRTKGYFKKSYEDKPLISIITVVFNGEKHLEETIQSVINQSYDNVEYIIIDGGSRDGTLDIIKQYEDKIDYWVSEADRGIYDAMNKGISLASGEYIGFLNADDWYIKSVLETIAGSMSGYRYDYYMTDVKIYEDDRCQTIFTPSLKKYKRYMPFCHQGLFVKSKILREEKFDTDYKIAGDYDLVIKLLEKKYDYEYIEIVSANFRNGGISNTQNRIKDRERFKIHYSHFGFNTAIIGYVIGTRQFPIYSIVQVLVYLKHKIFGVKNE